MTKGTRMCCDGNRSSALADDANSYLSFYRATFRANTRLNGKKKGRNKEENIAQEMNVKNNLSLKRDVVA
jgi:hypothetical protein